MAEVVIGSIGSDLTVNLAVSLILPLGPTDGVYCEEFCLGVLQLLSTDPASTADIKVYFYNKAFNRWAEDPTERRTLNLGEDYIRPFDVRANHRVIVKLTAKTGTYDRLWTFA